MENGESTRQTKRPGKEKTEEKVFGGIGSLKSYLIYQGIRGTTHIPRVGLILKNNQENPRLKPLENFWALHKQEGKIKTDSYVGSSEGVL